MKLQLSLLAAVSLLAGWYWGNVSSTPTPTPSESAKAILEAKHHKLEATLFESGYYMGVLDGTIDDEWLEKAKACLRAGDDTTWLDMISQRIRQEQEKRQQGSNP